MTADQPEARPHYLQEREHAQVFAQSSLAPHARRCNGRNHCLPRAQVHSGREDSGNGPSRVRAYLDTPGGVRTGRNGELM